MNKEKKRDLILMGIFPIFAMIVSLATKANLLVTIILFLGLPSIYLSYVNKEAVKKALTFSLILSIPISIVVDFFAVRDNSWYVPNTLFPRIFDLVVVEDIIWGFLTIYMVVMFYEYFLDKKTKEKPNKYLKYLTYSLLSLFIIFVIIYFTYPALRIPYFYLIWGIILIVIPAITFLSFFPKFISRYVKVASYFFVLLMLHEITSLQLGQWSFPGENFIGVVNLFGYTFPFEELLFLIALGPIAILSYYEFFADDMK